MEGHLHSTSPRSKTQAGELGQSFENFIPHFQWDRFNRLTVHKRGDKTFTGFVVLASSAAMNLAAAAVSVCFHA